ncbi:hypothetical protein [Streptomyces rimosus]|uniref:hypothetical protein n=1 Tax=Streptomyces rimosus TaxID=1927 RepID=UPI0037D8074F
MATHGCPPAQHRVQLQDGAVVTEECAQCGYRITYGPVEHDRAYPPARPPLASHDDAPPAAAPAQRTRSSDA